MDYRKLILGLSVGVAVGLGLLAFSPGGLLNRPGPQEVKIEMPIFGAISAAAPAPGLNSTGPVFGFILTGLGIVGFVVVWSMKPGDAKPAPLNL